jgi:hypothetical protein
MSYFFLFSYIFLLLVRKDIDVDGRERIFNITLRNKFK